MARFDLETWDHGKLIINRSFADLFRRHDLLTFDSIWKHTAEAAIAKKLRTDRITLRFTLDDGGASRVFYIKRHARSSWKEYIKPLLRLTWPILGARNEWNAILNFHEVNLPTMTPVAMGESGEYSFLITEALEGCTKLSELQGDEPSTKARDSKSRIRLIHQIAQITRTMHQAGMHHQDYYLGHLMQSNNDPDRIYVIDLGRVQKHKNLNRRWIVKDLAQLNFSAKASPSERLMFLRDYLGRTLLRTDRALIRQIQSKTAAINRHSTKNRL